MVSPQVSKKAGNFAISLVTINGQGKSCTMEFFVLHYPNIATRYSPQHTKCRCQPVIHATRHSIKTCVWRIYCNSILKASTNYTFLKLKEGCQGHKFANKNINKPNTNMRICTYTSEEDNITLKKIGQHCYEHNSCNKCSQFSP
jgi:hypothetical protein